jgi:hypothetical protein
MTLPTRTPALNVYFHAYKRIYQRKSVCPRLFDGQSHFDNVGDVGESFVITGLEVLALTALTTSAALSGSPKAIRPCRTLDRKYLFRRRQRLLRQVFCQQAVFFRCRARDVYYYGHVKLLQVGKVHFKK